MHDLMKEIVNIAIKVRSNTKLLMPLNYYIEIKQVLSFFFHLYYPSSFSSFSLIVPSIAWSSSVMDISTSSSWFAP